MASLWVSSPSNAQSRFRLVVPTASFEKPRNRNEGILTGPILALKATDGIREKRAPGIF